jgi:beta-glucanase (GH16 family)
MIHCLGSLQRRWIPASLLAGAIVCAFHSTVRAAPPGTGWTLTWREEFPDMPPVCSTLGTADPGWKPTDWYMNHTMGDANTYFLFPGIDAYNPFSVSSGALHIKAEKRTLGGKSHTSGWLSTAKGYHYANNVESSTSFHQTYGYFEARCKFPTAVGNSKGMWPGFWMLPAADDQSAVEYDIVEVLGNAPTKIYQTVHWDHYGTKASNTYTGPNSATGYHLYGFEWDATNIKWYVDDVLTYTQPNRYDGPMFLLLDLAVGGSWPGAPDASTVFPAYMDVGYVRAYAKNVALPSPWTTQDIGAPARLGAAYYSGGVFAVRGAGDNIWDASDQFRFVSYYNSGDCDIKTRVSSQQKSDPYAKAGVMIRQELLNAGSPNVFMAVTPSGFRLQYRSTNGGVTTNIDGGALNAAPNNWVRLKRVGNTFTGYKSSDGVNWTQVGSVSITMWSGIPFGMAVTSRNPGVLSTVKFDNVTATP